MTPFTSVSDVDGAIERSACFFAFPPEECERDQISIPDPYVPEPNFMIMIPVLNMSCIADLVFPAP